MIQRRPGPPSPFASLPRVNVIINEKPPPLQEGTGSQETKQTGAS